MTKTKKALVIDDDPDMARIVEGILPPTYEVLAAYEGMSAVEITNKTQVDLILLDIRMPLLSGFWFAEMFNKKPETKGIPIIVMSALSGEEEVKKAYELGACGYLKKPIHPQELLDLIRKAIV